MQKRKFGKTDMEITFIGFGSWAVGGSGWAAGWGSQDDEESVGAIRRSLELGVNWIDTAAVYGLGHSEEVVARALEGVPEAERPYVFTKCSMIWDENGEIGHSLKTDCVKRECEDSLRRLQTDVIDLYQIHWPNPDEEIEEGWAAMAELKKEGKVRHIGVSNFDVSQMKRAYEIAPVESLQPPYSMLSRDIEDEILPYGREQNIAVIVYSLMKSGLLTGKMTREGGEPPRGRLAQPGGCIQRASTLAQPGASQAAEGDREPLRRLAGRSRHRLDLEATGCHRCHCRRAQAGSGRRRRRRR